MSPLPKWRTAKHVFEALKAGIDILWIGARTSANPFAVQEIADALKGVDIPVLYEEPREPRHRVVDRCSPAHQQCGHHIGLGAIHRGFSNLRQDHLPQHSPSGRCPSNFETPYSPSCLLSATRVISAVSASSSLQSVSRPWI
jgi:hypothetical protein